MKTNKIRAVLVASIIAMAVAMAMVMLMPAAMGAPDTVTLNPNANGTYQEWNLVGPSQSHWEATSDNDVGTYIESDAEGERDVQNLSDPTFPDASTINSVTIYARCTVINGAKGPEHVVIITRTGDADYESDFTLTRDTWNDYSVIYTENPGGGSWTKAQITDLEVGSRASTLGSGETIQCSEYWIVVDYSAVSDATPPTWDTTPGGIQSATDTGNGGEVTVTYGTATDADSPPVKYNVYYNTSSPATGEGCTKISDVGSSPYTVTGLTNGQLYYFTVRAEDSATPPNEDNNTVERNATATAPPATPPTPYIVKYGYVFYENKTKCNGPVVNVTNQATGKEWQAETYDTSHYYELILDSNDVSADNTLEFNARDTDATQFNTTQHMVTQPELDDGGLFNFNLTLQEGEEENVVNDTAYAEISVKGTVETCDYTCTNESDDNYEIIQEESTAGNPNSRISSLEHKWMINVTGGTKTSVTFHVEAYRTDSGENDKFNFSYSTNDTVYYYMLTVTNTSDTHTYQTYELPTDLNGMVYINVTDTDRKVGHGDKDTIYIDHMFIRSVLGAPDTTPPTWDTTEGIQSATDTGNGGEVTVTYGNATDADSPPVKYNVYYNTSKPATGGTKLSDVGPSPYTVTGLTNGQLYYFTVRAEDNAPPPNEDNNTVELNATPTAPPPIPPTPYIVKYGYVFDKDGNDSNGPVVNVTNTDTTGNWQAETNVSYNYYELILDSKNVSAGHTLEFDARDTNATQFNTTNHIVTQPELDDGGLFNFNLTLQPGNTMHVDNISMWYTMTGPNYKIHTKVRIFNSSNGPVAGATVYLNLTLPPPPDGTNVSSFDFTGDDGTVEFIYGAKKKEGNYTSTVTDVINIPEPDWTYDSDANVDTSKTLPVP